MKKTIIIGLALSVSLLATSAMAQDTMNFNKGGAGIVGSSHDLSTGSYAGGDSMDRICIYCHHPHHSVKAADNAGTYSPLWNRTVPAASNFTAYNNGVMMQAQATGAQGLAGAPANHAQGSDNRNLMNGTPAVGGVSLLCMSCHDGVTAMNAYSENADYGTNAYGMGTGSGSQSDAVGSTDNVKITSNANLTEDLSNHHPIGMAWSDVQAEDPEIANDTVTFAGTNVSINDVLYGGKMECVSCHDVHNTSNQANAERFLWTSNNNSAFCLTCHLK